jgi:hypothetical protein
MSSRFSRRIRLLVIAAAMTATAPIFATTENWTGSAGDGHFSTAGNWSTDSVPGASDVAVFGLGASNSYTVTLGAASYSSQMVVDNNSLTLANGGYRYTLRSTGDIGSGSESLIVGNGAGDTAARLILGTSGYGKISGVSGTIGEASGSVGALTIGTAGNTFGSNALQLSGALAVGYGGNGTLTINAGSADVGGDLDIAALSGSIGKVDIELTSAGGCSFGPTPLQVGGNLYVGGSAAGAGGAGTLLINGTNGQFGSSSYGVQVTGTATIYSGSTVTLNQGLLEVASISNSGTLNFTGGTLDLTNSGFTVGSSGPLGSNVTLGNSKTLKISGTTSVASGATLTISGGELDTGTLSSGGGSISFTAGTLGITNSDLIIDTGGPLGNNVSLASGQTLNVRNNNLIAGNTGTGTLAVGSGAYVNANQIFIAATAGSTGNVTVDGTVGGSIFVGGNATGTGGTGTLTVNSDADMYGGTITVWRGGTLVDHAASNLNNTISIQPGGVMDTTGTSAIDGSSVTNAGLIEVQSGLLGLAGSGPLTNTGGTIQADNGTNVQLYATTITGGTLAGSGTGNFVSESATLDGTPSGGLTNNAFVNVNDSGSPAVNNSLTLQGAIVNNGQINISSTGDDTWLYINGPTTISGTGTIALADNGGNTAFLAGAPAGINDSLSNAGTIEGSGTVGNSSATNFDLQSFANSGTMDANVSGKTLVLGGADIISNTGTLEATNGGTLAVNRDTINNTGGNILSSGTNSVVNLSGTNVQGGTISQVNGGEIQLFGSGTYQTTTLDGSSSEVILGSNLTATTSNNLIISGNVQNNGNLNVQGPSGGLVGATLYFSGPTTLSGSGTVSMSSGSYFRGYNSTSTLANQSHIAGAGTIGGSTLDNSGTINANVNGEALSIGADVITNTGTIEATNGGIINFGGEPVANTGGTILASGTGSVAYLSASTQGGTISASNGGAVALNAGIVQGGTLTTDTQSTIFADNGTLDGVSNPVTNSGNLQAYNTGPHPGELTLKGTLDNTGEIIIHSGAYLYITGTVTLNGGGILQLNNTNNDPALLQGSDLQGGDVLINNSTIQGAGTIGNPGQNSTVTLTNTGTMDANVNGETLDVYGAVANTGILEATDGGTLYLHAAYTQNNGTTYFGVGGAGGGGGGAGGGGGVIFGGGFTQNGGYSYGGGYEYSGGDFYNTGGAFNPGTPQTGGGLAAIGETFNITYNYSASGAASTNFPIGGTGQGLSTGYDFLKVGGAFTAGGQLGIQFANNFQTSITSAETFDIIHASGGITGSFSNAVSGSTVETADGFGSFQINYGSGAASPNDVILSDFTFTPGGGGSAATAKIGTPLGSGENFSNTYSGSWVDPSGKTLVYTMTPGSGSLFTKIDAFRPGYDGLTITVDGITYTGFGGDNGYTNTFDFTSLTGGGAASFSIGNIATDMSDPFAVQLEFNTRTADFTVTPGSVPEPAALALFALAGVGMLTLRKRRNV